MYAKRKQTYAQVTLEDFTVDTHDKLRRDGSIGKISLSHIPIDALLHRTVLSTHFRHVSRHPHKSAHYGPVVVIQPASPEIHRSHRMVLRQKGEMLTDVPSTFVNKYL